MAQSNVPAHQPFAVQRPEVRVGGRRVFAEAVNPEAPNELAVGVVAAAGTNQATAAAVPLKPFVAVTAADGTKGVVLPQVGAGVEITIHNLANATLKVYPPTGDNINSGTINASINMAARSQARIISVDGVTYSVSFTAAA